jgi:hypothetical protein
MTEMQTVATLPQSPSPAALRMRRLRERRRQGRMCILFDRSGGFVLLR